MAAPTTPLPAAKAHGEDEPLVLQGYLDYHRVVLARKAEGITDDEARAAACPPSDLTLLGLIRHMTEVERHWFRRSLVDEDIGPVYGDADEDFRVPANATVADALAAYWDEIAVANQNLAAVSLGDLTPGPPDPGKHTVRRMIVHMIEAYARNCGHADLLRECIDGRTGQ